MTLKDFLRQNIDLALVICFCAVTAACIYIPYFSVTSLRVALAVLFMLFIPGYSLIAALFPAKDISISTRALFSFGMGIAAVTLIGLGLNYTPFGITTETTTASLLVFSVDCIAISAVRRYALPVRERFSVSVALSVATFLNAREMIFPRSEKRVDRTLTIVLIASMLIATSAFAYAEIFPQHGETFTEFYLLGPGGTANNYPTQFVLGNAKPVIVGVVNREHQQETYDLRVTLNNSTRTTTIYQQRAIIIEDNQTWQNTINLRPDQTGTNMKMEFLLFANGDYATPYRELHLWVNVTSSPKRAA